jgi:hypothetical protein
VRIVNLKLFAVLFIIKEKNKVKLLTQKQKSLFIRHFRVDLCYLYTGGKPKSF